MAILSKALAPTDGSHTSQSDLLDMAGDTAQPVTRLRYNFVQLQALVTVVLSYQLLFSRNVSLSQEVQTISILGLLLLCGSLMFLPTRLISGEWFPGALAVLDTGITSVLIYLSGNASSDLYLAYFVIILIVTASRTAMQMTVFLTMVTAIYGWALYKEIDESGVVLEHHLIRIPLLLIMAIFYRRTAASPELAGRLAQRILDAMTPRFQLSGQEVFVSASIGIAISSPESRDADSLIRNADAAMYRAKQRGKNSYEFYSPDMNAQGYERLMLESRLRKGLERNEIVVYYQPQVHLATRHIFGVEALARWNDPTSGLIPPLKFIPLAEETGLIVQIGESVLRQSCHQLKAWHRAEYSSLQVSVNLSALQFRQPDLASSITRVLAETGTEPRHLDLELTETCIMHNAETALRVLGQLKAMGVRISIDDFGTGYSSLIYLRRFPIDTLKIDRAFTQDIITSPDAEAITAAIIAMAAALKLEVIAEGVETDAQVALLQKQGCYRGQGFVFSKPVAAEEMTKLLSTWPNVSVSSPTQSNTA